MKTPKKMPASRGRALRVLAVDPGYGRLGIAVLEGDPSKPVHLWSDCIQPASKEPSERLAQIAAAISEALDTYSPDVFAIESLFFGANRSTAIGVAEVRGATLALAGARNLRISEHSPQSVKLAVTGYGRAEKSAVARMIPRLIALPPKKRLDDELDAIALGIAALGSARR